MTKLLKVSSFQRFFLLPELLIDNTVDNKVEGRVEDQENVARLPNDEIPHGEASTNPVLRNAAL